MPARPLAHIPNGGSVFIDANIFIYALNGLSAQCHHLLERCSREEVTGISLFEIVNEATHRLMIAEAYDKGLISHMSAEQLRQNFKVIPKLSEHWRATETILTLNLLLLSTDEPSGLPMASGRAPACSPTTQ